MARPTDPPLEYLGGRKKLSEMELEFMRFIWNHPDGVSSEELYQNFPQSRGTKSTTLYNISEKGYVQNRQQGLHHVYTALVSQEEYEQALLRQQIKNSFGNVDFEKLVAAFCGRKSLTKRQLDKISELMEELENDDSENE